MMTPQAREEFTRALIALVRADLMGRGSGPRGRLAPVDESLIDAAVRSTLKAMGFALALDEFINHERTKLDATKDRDDGTKENPT